MVRLIVVYQNLPDLSEPEHIALAECREEGEVFPNRFIQTDEGFRDVRIYDWWFESQGEHYQSFALVHETPNWDELLSITAKGIELVQEYFETTTKGL